MGHPAVAIPEKIFFKIGEVCDILDVQAHVLRYWETEFPMLSPEKNRSGQRSYRRRDVEVALRIKELLYDELYTIAGAKKKLQSELREASKLKIVPAGPEVDPYAAPDSAMYLEPEEDFDADIEIDDEMSLSDDEPQVRAPKQYTDRRQAIEDLAANLLELREMLSNKKS